MSGTEERRAGKKERRKRQVRRRGEKDMKKDEGNERSGLTGLLLLIGRMKLDTDTVTDLDLKC